MESKVNGWKTALTVVRDNVKDEVDSSGLTGDAALELTKSITQQKISSLLCGNIKPQLDQVEIITDEMLDSFDESLAHIFTESAKNGSSVNEELVNGLADILASLHVMNNEVNQTRNRVDNLHEVERKQ
jgi:ABC-type transporter Mla subunit MlaD